MDENSGIDEKKRMRSWGNWIWTADEGRRSREG